MNLGRQRGYILVPAIFMLALLAVVTYLINTDSAANLNLTKQQGEAQRARYVAEAGLAHAAWLANNSACTGYHLASTTFQAGSYSATFVPNYGSPVNVLATGVLADGSTASVERANVTVYDEVTVNSLLLQPGDEGEDTFLWDGAHKDTNFGAADRLELNNASAERVILMRFDLSSLPASATVKSAKLALYLEEVGSTGISNGVVGAHRITRSWFEGVDDDVDPPTAPGATYQKYDGTKMWASWANAGGDYDPTPVDSTTIASLTEGWYQWDVTELADGGEQSALANDGVLLRASAGTIDKIRFTSSDNSGDPARPKLTITYTCECGTSCASTPAPSCEADYTPMSKASEFSAGSLGANDVEAITYIPEGTLFNGALAPADGAWILLDAVDDLIYMTAMDGTQLTTLAMPVADVNGGVYISSGSHADELALTTGSGSVVFVNMEGDIVSTLATGDFGVGQPAAIGFVAASGSGTYDGNLLVLDRSSEIVTVIDQAGAELGTIDVNDGLAPFVRDVKHLPGSDKLIVTYDCCKNAIFDFSGAKLREYDLIGFGVTVAQASAIQPLTCEHVVADADADTLMYLAADAQAYIETYQTWGANQNDSWEAVDLGALGVPPGAVVEVAVVNSDAVNQRFGGVRAVGSILDRRLQLHQAENGRDLFVMHVQADALARIEHYADDINDVSFIVLGYWTVGVYEEAWDFFEASAKTTWLDHALGDYDVGSGQVAEIVITNDDASKEREAGVRTDGSSDQRIFDIHKAKGGGVDAITLFVNAGSDPDATVEIYAQRTNDIDFYHAGYWSEPPGNYVENASPGNTAAIAATWQDVDLNAAVGVPAGAVVSITMMNDSNTLDNPMGVRESGSALPRVLHLQEAEGGGADLATLHVNTDTSATMQWYSTESGEDAFRISGWWVIP